VKAILLINFLHPDLGHHPPHRKLWIRGIILKYLFVVLIHKLNKSFESILKFKDCAGKGSPSRSILGEEVVDIV